MAGRAQPGMTVLPKATRAADRSLSWGAGRDGAARGLLVRTGISYIEENVNGGACTARNDCATKGDSCCGLESLSWGAAEMGLPAVC
jgi:hypothetical protein